MNLFYSILAWLYAYCTDFIICLANLTGTSYYEVNVVIFCILCPLLTVLLTIVWCYYRWKVSTLK